MRYLLLVSIILLSPVVFADNTSYFQNTVQFSNEQSKMVIATDAVAGFESRLKPHSTFHDRDAFPYNPAESDVNRIITLNTSKGHHLCTLTITENGISSNHPLICEAISRVEADSKICDGVDIPADAECGFHNYGTAIPLHHYIDQVTIHS